MKRADFLKLSALSLTFPGIMQANTAKQFTTQNNKVSDNPDHYYWNKGTRLTIAMWDFSWLTDQGKGGSYENIEKCVAEAAERGYNTLRIDCFPSRILEGITRISSYNPGESKIMPCWGRVTTEFSCNTLQKLKELADACRKHNIWLGLDSWEKGHMMGQQKVLGLDKPPIPLQSEEKVLRDFAHTWVKALRLMREEGILERSVWVAPMNEVPHFASGGLESIRQINNVQRQIGRASCREKV